MISLPRAVELLTWGPVRTLSLPGGTLPEGAAADLVMFDPDFEWIIEPESLASKSKNTPFSGMTMRGRPRLTLVGGKVVFDADGAAS